MDLPKARMVSTNGIEIAVHEAGQGGIPIVLAHGWPELAYSWRFQIPALVEKGYHVIAPDQRGYGDSSKPEEVEAYDIHQLTADHAGLLDALGIEKAIYVGHDWGAIVVWNYGLMYPQRVAGIANLSVPFRVREPSDPVAFWERALGQDFYIVHFNRQPGVAARAFDENPELFLRNMYRTGQWLGKESVSATAGQSIVDRARFEEKSGELMLTEDELSVFVAAFRKGGFTAPCAWYRNFTRNWETTSEIEQIIRMPSLMIYGQYDMVPKSDMAPYVADLEIHTLECGHWIQQEKPEETNTILLEWLERRMKPLFASS